MIYGNIYTQGQEFLHPALKKAVDFLKDTDFANLEPQKFILEGDDMFATLMEITTDDKTNKKAEAHKKYIDIQFSVTGDEVIGTTLDTGNYEVLENKLEEKDVIFYKNIENENFLLMNKGDFAIFFPSDIHRPGCSVNSPKSSKKVVVKIATNLLNS